MPELKGTQMPGQSQEAIREQMDELQTLAAPLVEWLWKNHDPHTEIHISWEYVSVKHDEIGLPFHYPFK